MPSALCPATLQYFTFHNQCAVTSTSSPTCDDVPTPGADEAGRAWRIPSDPRAGTFVYGSDPAAPLDAGAALGSSVLNLFAKVKAGGGFWAYPVHVSAPVTLTLRHATTLTVLDAADGSTLLSRAFADGEGLPLEAGRDVIVYGGAAQIPSGP